MATTVGDIEKLARNLLDDDRGEKQWKNTEDMYPWLHEGRTVLRSIRPETQLSSDGASITTFTRLENYGDVIAEPDRFAECLAEYVVYMCLMSVAGDQKKPVRADKHKARFYELAATL